MKKIKKFTQDWSNSGGNGMGIMGPSEGGLGFGTPGGGGEGLGNRINLPPSHQGHSGNLAPGPWSGDNIIDESLKTGFFSQSIGDFTVEELINKIRALMKVDTRESRDLVVFLKRILDDKMRRVKAARRSYDTDKIVINSTAVAQLKQDPFTIALFAEHNVPISKIDNVEIPAEVSHFTLHTLVHKIATTDLVGTIEQGLSDIETKVLALEKPDTTLDPIYIQNIYTELSEIAETFASNSSDITNSKEISAKIRELKCRIADLSKHQTDNINKAEEALTTSKAYSVLVKFLNKVRALYKELVAGKGSLEQVDDYVSEFEKLKQEIQLPTQSEKMLMTLIKATLIRISNAGKHSAPQILNTLKQTPIDNWPDLIEQLKQTYTEKQLHYFFEYSGEWKDMFAALRTKFGAGEPVAKISKQDFYDFYTAMLALTYSADAPSSVQNALARAILRLAEAVVSSTRFGIRFHIEYPLLGAPAVWAKVKSRFGSLQDVFTAFHNDKLSTEDLVALTYLAYEEAPSMLDVWRPIAIEAAKLDKLVEQGVDLQGIAQQTDHLIDYAHHRGKIGDDWLPIQDVANSVELMTEKSEKWDEKFLQEHSPRFYNIYKRLQRISKLRSFTKLAQGTAQPFKGKCPESDKTVYTTHSKYVQNDFKADCPEGKRKLRDMKSVSIEEYKKHKKKRKKKHKGYSLVGAKVEKYLRVHSPEMNGIQKVAFTKYSQKSLSFTPEEQQIINAVKEISDELNIKCYLVGGSVRDKLLGKEESDLDFMCENRAEELVARLNEKYNTSDPVQYDRSKALMVTLGGKSLDFINAERLFIPLKQDDESLEGEDELTTSFDDAYRRDLTINTLMYDLSTGEIIDPTNRGLKDLREGIINTVIDPFIKFKVHAPDMLRALRFAVSLGFELGPNMIEAMRANAGRVRPRDKGGDISNRRIRRELRKVIDTPEHWAKMRRMLSDAGLDIILADDVDDVQADFQGSINYHFDKEGVNIKRFTKTSGIEEKVKGIVRKLDEEVR